MRNAGIPCRAIVLAAAGLALSACSSSSDKPDSGVSGDPFEAEPVARSLAEAQCKFIARCRPGEFAFFNYRDEAGCVADTKAEILLGLSPSAAAIQAGRVRYTAEKLTACVGELGGADCILGLGKSSACDALFSGVQADDAPCYYSDECAEGFYCAKSSACGTCQPVAARGASCASAPCSRQDRCLNVAEVGASESLACVPRYVEEGQPCGTAATGLCAGILQCTGTSPSLTCQRPAAKDAACTVDATTAPGCAIDVGLTCLAATCQTITWGGSGSSCVDAGRCDVEAYCPAGATACSALPTAGESCAAAPCGEGLYCDAQDTCAAVKSAGASCTSNLECSPLLCVASASGGVCGEFKWRQCD